MAGASTKMVMQNTGDVIARPLSTFETAHVNFLLANLAGRISYGEKLLQKSSQFSPPDETPVVLASWKKSGTTLAQQMVYQLLVRTGAVATDPTGTDFGDISAVVPFIEMTSYVPNESVHTYLPTVWKTHGIPDEFKGSAYNGARFIVAVRDGRAVMRSYADFVTEWIGGYRVPEQLRSTFYDRLFRILLLGCPSLGTGDPSFELVEWFAHVKAWRDDPNFRGRLLFLIFEDIVQDLPEAVRDVAKFLNIPCDAHVVRDVACRCSRNKMAGDPRFNENIVSSAFGLSEDGGVRVQAEGKKGRFQDVVSKRTEAQYGETFMKAFGVGTYEELKEHLRERNRELFMDV